MAALASRVKTSWGLNPAELRSVAEGIAAIAYERNLQVGLPESSSLVKEQATLYGLIDLDPTQRSLILKDSISSVPLHRSLVLKSLIETSPETCRESLKLALAWTLVNHAGNLRFGPEVGITRPKVDVDVTRHWLEQVYRMAVDLESYRHLSTVRSIVYQADARSIPEGIPDRSIDFVFTSPPYPNEKDYTRTTRLESVILDLIQSKSDLRQLKMGLVRSNTRNVYVADEDHKFVANISEIQRISQEIEDRRVELGKTSGFERLYHKVAKLYFGGMSRHLGDLRRVLKPGAMLGYVVGDQASYLRVMIRTGEILAQVAEMQGYEVVDLELFRTRYATATRDQLREEVLILRWPGA